jgi:hypothetical protein
MDILVLALKEIYRNISQGKIKRTGNRYKKEKRND